MTPTTQISLVIQDLLILVGVWSLVVVLWRRSPQSSWFGWMKRIALVVTAACVVVGPSVTKSPTNGSARRTQCLSNIKQFTTGLIMYSGDNDDRFPLPSQWQEDTAEYVNNQDKLLCVVREVKAGYAYNANLTKAIGDRDEEILLLGESARNDRNMLIRTSADIVARHSIPIIGFMDGHSKAISPKSKQKVFLRGSDIIPINLPLTATTPISAIATTLSDQFMPLLSVALWGVGLIYAVLSFKNQSDEHKSLRNWAAGLVILSLLGLFIFFPLIGCAC